MMDGPAEGAIFKVNHLGEIGDICSKLILNLAKAGECYHHAHAWLLNPTNQELSNFVANWERDFNSHCHHIHHLDSLLDRDSRHRIQLGYPVINLPHYIPTTVELCNSHSGT